ncbi:MAG: glycosyltransferase family 2 protein [Planctomycetia bacterium]|nr:glycosyltransferase family 2 protein [Planctomycetia bacterium]
MNRESTPIVANHVGRKSRDLRPALFISVIVPVRNEARFIGQTLGQLAAQDYPKGSFEILVIDGQSTDDTVAVVRQLAEKHDCLRCYSNPLRLSSAARNVGIRHARGDVVLIVDGHCEIPDDQMLANLARAFDESGADCIGRPQPLDISDASALQRAIAAARSSRLGHHPESFIYSSQPRFVPAHSVAVAYRREVFDRVGDFDERFDAHEDGELNYRCDQAGLKCYFTPEIAVKYHPRDSLSGLFRQMIRYGRGRVRFLRKHPRSPSLGTLLPAVLVVGLVAGAALSPVSPWLAAAYLGLVLLYIAVILCGAVWTAIEARDPALLPWLPLLFATIHVGAGVGVLCEILPLTSIRHHSDENDN